jgi:hypothetical protein
MHGIDEECIKTMTVRLNVRGCVGDRAIDGTLYYAYSIEMDLKEMTCENVTDNHGGVLGTRKRAFEFHKQLHWANYFYECVKFTSIIFRNYSILTRLFSGVIALSICICISNLYNKSSYT